MKGDDIDLRPSAEAEGNHGAADALADPKVAVG